MLVHKNANLISGSSDRTINIWNLTDPCFNFNNNDICKYRIKETGDTGVSLNDLVLNVCGMDEILSRNENKFGQYKVMNLDSELKLKKK